MALYQKILDYVMTHIKVIRLWCHTPEVIRLWCHVPEDIKRYVIPKDIRLCDDTYQKSLDCDAAYQKILNDMLLYLKILDYAMTHTRSH